MPEPSWVRVLRIVGTKKRATLQIAGPVQEKPAFFTCAFQIPELGVQQRKIFGADPLQAMSFCLHAVFMEIDDLARRDLKLYWVDPDDVAGFNVFRKRKFALGRTKRKRNSPPSKVRRASEKKRARKR